MTYRFVTRATLEDQLFAALADPSAEAALRAWIRDVIVGDDVELDGPAGPLILAVVEQLDLTCGSGGDLMSVARDLAGLLRDVSDHDVARNLVPVARERRKMMLVLGKVLSGNVSRTGWLSYIGGQRWEATLKNGLSALNAESLTKLRDALLDEDYITIAETVDPTH